MTDLNAFTDWLLACTKYVATVVFTKWGVLGLALFSFPILRKLVKIFSDTF